MSSIGFGLTSGNINGGSVSQTASPMLLSPNNGQSRCGMHESHATGDRSSAGSNSVGGGGSVSGDNFSSVKMSGGLSDCSIAAAAAAATALVQNSCAKSNRDDYENLSRKNNMGGVGGSNNNVSYADFTARQMTPIGSSGANGENVGSVAVPTLSHSGGGGNKSRMDTGIPDDSKLLANPKGIIKSFLPQAAACDSQKFDAYRELCLAHADEYYKNQKGGAMWAVCHVCNSTHPHWNTLQRHLQTHIDFRPFVCDQCGRTFYSQSKLKRHQVIHNEVKPYKCPVCDRRLGRTEHLKRHLLVHTDDKPYGCSSCAHTTKRLDGIRRHIKRKHGIGGAEIVVLSGRAESQTLSDLRQVMSAIDESEQRGQKPKKKKKKKKKKNESNQNQNMQQQQQQQQQQSDMDAVNAKDYEGNLLEVAARFGLSDLRLPGSGSGGGISSAGESDRGGFDNGGGGSGVGGQSKDVKNSFHEGGHSGRGGGGGRGTAENLSVEEMKPSWDGGLLLGGLPSQQMHLLYHSLARSHPAAHGDGGSSMGGGIGSGPCNLSGNNNDTGAGGVGSSSNNLRQPSFCHDRGPMSSPDHTFIMNSSSVPMRYLPSVGVADNNPARHVNPMLFSPRSTSRNLGHFGATDMNMPAEAAMISQYIQSQQRFAPPVWGFANPNYHNY